MKTKNLKVTLALLSLPLLAAGFLAFAQPVKAHWDGDWDRDDWRWNRWGHHRDWDDWRWNRWGWNNWGWNRW